MYFRIQESVANERRIQLAEAGLYLCLEIFMNGIRDLFYNVLSQRIVEYKYNIEVFIADDTRISIFMYWSVYLYLSLCLFYLFTTDSLAAALTLSLPPPAWWRPLRPAHGWATLWRLSWSRIWCSRITCIPTGPRGSAGSTGCPMFRESSFSGAVQSLWRPSSSSLSSQIISRGTNSIKDSLRPQVRAGGGLHGREGWGG